MKAMTVKVGPLPPFLRSEMSKSKLKFALAEEKMRQSNDRKPYHVQWFAAEFKNNSPLDDRVTRIIGDNSDELRHR